MPATPAGRLNMTTGKQIDWSGGGVPRTFERFEDGEWESVEIEEIKVGDCVRAFEGPGELVSGTPRSGVFVTSPPFVNGKGVGAFSYSMDRPSDVPAPRTALEFTFKGHEQVYIWKGQGWALSNFAALGRGHTARIEAVGGNHHNPTGPLRIKGTAKLPSGEWRIIGYAVDASAPEFQGPLRSEVRSAIAPVGTAIGSATNEGPKSNAPAFTVGARIVETKSAGPEWSRDSPDEGVGLFIGGGVTEDATTPPFERVTVDPDYLPAMVKRAAKATGHPVHLVLSCLAHHIRFPEILTSRWWNELRERCDGNLGLSYLWIGGVEDARSRVFMDHWADFHNANRAQRFGGLPLWSYRGVRDLAEEMSAAGVRTVIDCHEKQCRQGDFYGVNPLPPLDSSIERDNLASRALLYGEMIAREFAGRDGENIVRGEWGTTHPMGWNLQPWLCAWHPDVDYTPLFIAQWASRSPRKPVLVHGRIPFEQQRTLFRASVNAGCAPLNISNEPVNKFAERNWAKFDEVCAAMSEDVKLATRTVPVVSYA